MSKAETAFEGSEMRWEERITAWPCCDGRGAAGPHDSDCANAPFEDQVRAAQLGHSGQIDTLLYPLPGNCDDPECGCNWEPEIDGAT